LLSFSVCGPSEQWCSDVTVTLKLHQGLVMLSWMLILVNQPVVFHRVALSLSKLPNSQLRSCLNSCTCLLCGHTWAVASCFADSVNLLPLLVTKCRWVEPSLLFVCLFACICLRVCL